MASKASMKELDRNRVLLNKKISGMVEATKELVSPLRTLNKNQIAAVILLIFERDILMHASKRSTKLDRRLLRKFKAAVEAICPDLAPVLEISRYGDPCMEHSVAYISALAKCDKDGKGEEECPDAWGPGMAEIYCTMEQIKDFQPPMIEVWEGFRDPKPFPWLE